jgi:20S proteasome subunit beta 2
MAIFESEWKVNMEVSLYAIYALISLLTFLYSEKMPCEGCYHISRNIQLDACIITANRTEMLRNVEIPNQRVQKERDYKFRRGTTTATAWKKEDIQKLIIASILTELRF